MGADRIRDIRAYEVKAGDRLLIDTNAWLAYAELFSDAGDQARLRPYGRLVKDAFSVGANLFLSAPVFTEFFNVWVDAAWRSSAEHDRSDLRAAKSFRLTEQYREAAAEASAQLRQIEPDTVWVEVMPSHAMAALRTLSTGARGVVDQILVELCRALGATLVTDDSDFAGCGVPVLTANRRLLDQNEW